MWSDNLSILIGTVIRLCASAICGGVIGIERGVKRRPAGFRTHILICIGATLTMMISQYIAALASMGGMRFLPDGYTSDTARLGAQVINGISFLGAGTIIVTGNRQVKGLTTAAGLWASACMGLAVGAGFYVGALIVCIYIVLSITLFSHFEAFIISRSRNMNIHVEFSSIEVMSELISGIKATGVHIYDIELNKNREAVSQRPGIVVSMRLPKRVHHADIISQIAAVDCVRSIEEI